MNKVFSPLKLKAHIKETFEIYRKNFSNLIAITAIGLGPIFLFGKIGGKIESPTLLLAVGLIGLCCAIVAWPLIIGALIHAVSEQFLRQKISVSRSYNFAWKRITTLMGSTFLAILAFIGFVIILFGFFAAISSITGKKSGVYPGVILFFVVNYFIVSWSFIWEAALLEGLSSKGAVLRSLALVRGNWWRVWGMMFVLGIIISPINAIFGKIPGIGGIIGGIFTTPFIAVGHILLYYDLRLRKEGYDVETLAGELHIKPDSRFINVWDDLSNEAFTLYQQGQFSKAAKRLQEALKAAEDALGPEHLDVATILRNLAGLSEAQGKYGDAEPFYSRLLKIKEKALGKDHPDVAVTCENMAKLYRQIGKVDEASKLETRARKIRSK